MRQITFLFMTMIAAFGFSQQVVVQDFEDSDAFVFAGFGGLNATIVSDPATGGTNGNTLQLVTSNDGMVWQGGEIVQDIETLFFDMSSDITMSIDVYATQAFTLMAKLEQGQDGAPNAGAAQDYSTPNEWQTLTFTFNESLDNTTTANGVYRKLVFFPNWDSNSNNFGASPQAFTVNVDNITSEALVPEPPQPVLAPGTAAPTPPARPANGVISVYGDAYGPAVGLNNVPWDEGTEFYEETHNGEQILRIDFGTAFMGSNLGSVVDASEMTHFHIDYWIADDFQVGQVFNMKWSNHSGGSGETDAGDLNIAFSGSEDVQNWVSIDVPFTDFETSNGDGLSNREALTQFLITMGGTLNNAYITNIYLHNQTLSNPNFDKAVFNAYPNPTGDVWNIQTTENIQVIEIFNTTGRLIKELNVAGNEARVDASDLSVGIYFARISNEYNQTKTIKLIKN